MTEMNETNPSTVLPGQERYVAPLDETPLKAVDSMDESAPASNMWADAWRTLRKNPLFIISGLLIIFIVFINDAERRIPVQYAKRQVGRKNYRGCPCFGRGNGKARRNNPGDRPRGGALYPQARRSSLVPAL